jgi:hypothetical protein
VEDPEIDPESDPEPEPETPDPGTQLGVDPDIRHLERLLGSLLALDDETLRLALATMSETNRAEVGTALQLPKAAMHLGDALVPLVRRKARASSPQRQLSVAFAVSDLVNDTTIAALGDRSDDPSRDDMLEVLPGVIERHGVPLVNVMLAAYAASEAPCAAVFAELLDTDERFVIAPPPPADDEAAGPVTAAPVRDDAAHAEKRAQRKAGKAARREAEARKRAAAATAQAKRKEAQREAKRGRGQ